MAHVIVGLGNPGSGYAHTRHNAGRMAVEAFARAHGFPVFKKKFLQHASVSVGEVAGQKVTLVLPEVFMNVSGKAVAPFVKNPHQAEQLLVVRDELDLPVGSIKMTGFGRGSGGQNGVESIMAAIKTKNFAQLKVGIARASDGDTSKHVLSTFRPEEKAPLEAALSAASASMRAFIEGGLDEGLKIANTGS